MMSLANGCVCCEIRDDLVASVESLLARPKAVEYVILEASGVADPAGIFMTFNDSGLRDRIRLDSVTCVIDADQVFAYPEYPPLLDLKLRQVGFADIVILNKVSLAGRDQLTKVRKWLDDHLDRARIVQTGYCEVPLDILLSVGRFHPARAHQQLPKERDEHAHSNVFNTWSYETDRPFSLEALREVARKLPGNIYRAKGIIYSKDSPDRPGVLQLVGRRLDISLQDSWGERQRRTQIVAIGAAGSIDASSMEKTFASCISALDATA